MAAIRHLNTGIPKYQALDESIGSSIYDNGNREHKSYRRRQRE